MFLHEQRTRDSQKCLLGSSNVSTAIGKAKENVLKSINEKCANCALNFKDEYERNAKFNITKQSNEIIEIIDAIFYIYGLTVDDWSKTLTSIESDYSCISETLFCNGIPFCSKCTSALQNVYTAHKCLKDLADKESLFVKALFSKSMCEIEIKTEIDEKQDDSSLNFSEIIVKNDLDDIFPAFDLDESTLESNFELEDPLELELGLNDQQSSNILFDLPAKSKLKTVDENVSSENVKIKTKGRYTDKNKISPKHPNRISNYRRLSKKSKPSINKSKKILPSVSYTRNEVPLESSWSVQEIKELNANISISEVRENLQQCFVSIDRLLIVPNQTKQNDHPFNILCCDTSFETEEIFVAHKLLHANEETSPKLVKCNICEMLIPIDNVMSHMNSYNKLRKKYFNCKTCNSQFISASDMTDHFKAHDPKYVTLACDLCEAPMSSEYQRIVHKVRNHSQTPFRNDMFPCNICGSDISGLQNFRFHYEKHDPSNRVTCKVCARVFPTAKNLYCHMKRIHIDHVTYKYSCTKCNVKFHNEYYLKEHIKNNVCNRPKRRFVCEKCGKTFLAKRHYNVHMQQHRDEECPNRELFKCPHCEKMMKHRYSLRKHIYLQHPENEKIFFCEKCGKTTKNMTNMRTHMKVHEKEIGKGVSITQR